MDCNAERRLLSRVFTMSVTHTHTHTHTHIYIYIYIQRHTYIYFQFPPPPLSVYTSLFYIFLPKPLVSQSSFCLNIFLQSFQSNEHTVFVQQWFITCIIWHSLSYHLIYPSQLSAADRSRSSALQTRY